VRRDELESFVRALLNTLEPLEVHGTPGLEFLERTMRASKGLAWANFDRFTILAAEIDSETARHAQELKRDLSWLNDRIAEIKSYHPLATNKPSLDAPEWNNALLGSRSTLTEMLKRLDGY
jgi:hypothetical protein